MDLGEWEARPFAASTDEDVLLREALAFIGDLDDGELSPGDLGDAPAGGPDSGLFASLLAAPLSSDAASSPLEVKDEVTALMATLPPATSALATPLALGTSKPGGNRSRTKRREELLYLREMVGNLETQLVNLKRSAEDKQAQIEGEAAKPETESSIIVRSAWEQIATRQYEQRQRSEMENIRLKRLLEDQIQVGRSLERLLSRKRPKFEAAEATLRTEKRTRRSSMSVSWDNTKIFQELVATVKTLNLETDKVIAKVPVTESRQRDIQIIHDPEFGMVLRTMESHILPFQYDHTIQEFWATVPDISSEHIRGYHNIEATDDEIKVQFQIQANFARQTGSFTVSMVNRRVVEANRTVFLMTAFFDPSEISDTKMDGVYMRHRGWVVFEPADHKSSLTQAATKMTAYHLSVPEVFENVADQDRKVGTLTNFIFGAISVEMNSRYQELENRLFDRSCAMDTGS